MPLQLLNAPTTEPLSLVEAKLHARVTQTAEDALITALISAARDYAQNKTQHQLVAARYKYTIDAFPGPSLNFGVPFGKPYGLPEHAILLPIGSVLAVESIQYLDMAGVLQTMPSSDYVVEASGDPARITPVFGKIWPIPLPQIGAVSVTFRAGMVAPLTGSAGTDTINVPGWKTLAVNDAVRMSFRDKAAAGDGKLPLPLLPNVDYYVQAVTGPDTYKLSATPGGAAIDLTDAGGGDMFIGVLPQGLLSWMKLSISTLYENRPAVLVDQRVAVAELPLEFLDGLLDPYRMVIY